MEPVLPDLQASVLCEDVRQEMNGMQTIVGVISVIPTPKLPLGFLKLCLWTRWCSGVGTFRQISRILDTDDQKVIAESSVNFELKEIESHATNIHCFGGIQFHHYGIHHVEIRLEDQLRLRFPLAVVRVPMPGQ